MSLTKPIGHDRGQLVIPGQPSGSTRALFMPEIFNIFEKPKVVLFCVALFSTHRNVTEEDFRLRWFLIFKGIDLIFKWMKCLLIL